MSNSSTSEAWLETAEQEHLSLHGNYSLGRSQDNHRVIASDLASRRHAVIHAQEGGEYWLADLGSSNGTFLNGRRLIRPTRLRDGDTVTIAHQAFTFRQVVDEAAEAAAFEASQRTVIDVRTEPCWLLVADLENFTEVSQTMAPKELSALVGKWIRVCQEQIEGHRGVINKYLGDGFFAFWRGGEEMAEEVAAAILGLMKAHAEATIKFRIILHHGHVSLGGRAALNEDSLMGSEVNFVFRMEKAAGELKIPFCASSSAEPLLAGKLIMTPVPGEHQLKGFSKKFTFFTIEG